MKQLKKGTYYKFMIVALDKNNNVVSSSKIVHVATKGGKVGNAGKVTIKAKKNKVSIKKGKTFKLKGKKKGTCYVYAYAQNGVFAKIKVTVK